MVWVIGFLVGFGLVWGFYWYFSRLEEQKEPTQPLGLREACEGPHEWDELIILTKEDGVTAMAMPPEEREKWLLSRPAKRVCSKCGYVSGMDRMLKDDRLEKFQHTLRLRKEAEQRKRDLDELKEEWFAALIDREGGKMLEVELLRKGYEAHAQFVENLPELMKKRQAQRIMELLKQGGKK